MSEEIHHTFYKMNFFHSNLEDNKYDGVITDPPYKRCIINKLNEENFNIEEFMKETDRITQQNAFLIVFSNFAMSYDLRKFAELTNWKFHTYQIWNKEPIRNWISWTIPLRSCEFIMYFKKGNFKFNFKTGKVNKPYNRKNFGGSLKETKKNTNKVSYEMFREIILFKNGSKKIHPTEKPIEFSQMFRKIVGNVYVIDPFAGSGNLVSEFDFFDCLDITDKYWSQTNEK